MNPINEERSRLAQHELGAQLQGEFVGQLFDAAPAHLADHHSEPLGAVELDLGAQLTGENPGASNA